MQRFFFSVCALALARAFCLNIHAADLPDNGPDHTSAPPKSTGHFDPKEPIDDKLLYELLESKCQSLIAAKTTLCAWKDKLSPRTVALDLPQRPPKTNALTPAQVFQRAESGVVVIGILYKCDKCPRNHVATASGAVLTADGVVATDYHVLNDYVANGMGVVVLTRDGRSWPVKDILAADPANDLLVLQLDLSTAGDTSAKLTPLVLGSEAPVGTPLNVISHPSQHFYFFTTGIAARYSKSGGVKYLSITSDFAKGSSGAPVLNEHAEIVGMVRSTNSISYDNPQPTKDSHQMVIHNCSTVDALKKLVTTPYIEPPKVEPPKVDTPKN